MSAGALDAEFLRPAPVAAVGGAPLAKGGKGSLRFEALGKTYRSSAGAVEALKEISLAIAPGEIYGIIGRSGAGTSSLLRMINRLEVPSTGRALVDGEDIARLDEGSLVALRRRIGMIFQHFNLLSARTVRENVALPLIGLQGKGDSYPSRLSGGQKQRVGVARALLAPLQRDLPPELTAGLRPGPATPRDRALIAQHPSAKVIGYVPADD